MSAPADDGPDTLPGAFERECRELGLLAQLSLSEGYWQPLFQAQFGAEGAWLAQILFEELRARGWADARGWPCRSDVLAEQIEGLCSALRRTRARLVDSNSWVSGGLAWPWPIADEVLRTRGLATYRAPARAPVELELTGAGARITLPECDCGEVVSGGFWVPTALAGDFELALDYRIAEWHAGEREACLGLLAVATDGTFRAYAQRVAAAGQPVRVVADLDGRPGPVAVHGVGDTGTLRILREREELSFWHRSGAQWRWLGRLREPQGRPLITGFKIWASGHSGPLRAELGRFSIEGCPAAKQDAPPAARPDPRHAT